MARRSRRVKNKRFKAGKIVLESPKTTDNYTSEYKALFCENILKLSADEFEDFICKHYDCDTYAGTHQTKNGPVDIKIGEMQLQTDQNAAYRQYQDIIRKLTVELKIPLDRCNYGLWFADIAAFKKFGYDNIKDKLKNIDDEDFKLFIELLQGVNAFIGYTAEEKISNASIEKEWKEPATVKTKALFVSSANEVTRTSIIVAYYYYYNALHLGDYHTAIYGDDENEKSEKLENFKKSKNFGALFNDFKNNVDQYLKNANYQELSGKNIFDVLVVFSSYAYLNL